MYHDPNGEPNPDMPAPLTADELGALMRDASRQIGASVYDTWRLVTTVERARSQRDAARFENEDLRWLVGWLAKDVVRATLPPRLVPLVIEAKRDMSWSKYTVAGPYDLVPAEVDAVRRAQATTEETSHE